jgi:cellulose synthase/poly-beta-1,6-N-acetylglucosamine synthase-like glycosyltransferase
MNLDFLLLFLVIIFWISVFLIVYSYVFFPWILSQLAKDHKKPTPVYNVADELPMVSILISAFNEQEVIEAKLNSVFHTGYPAERFEVLVGSDASQDNTNSIVTLLCLKYPNLKFFPYSQRSGKGNVINRLINQSRGDILIFTDANVMLEKETIFELVKHFKNPQIGLVDSQMVNTNLQNHGISKQEKAYISREVLIKQDESNLWGTMMGPFGGCFAIRRELYEPVPKNFLVDDFFVNMTILEKGYSCVNNLNARVFEDVSNSLADEFRRKIRIATGNFQNLRRFSKMLWHKTKGLSFCFISHKVLRWIGPFLMILALITSLILSFEKSELYLYLFIFQFLFLLIPAIDYLLKKMHIHVAILRLMTHFYAMNLALLIGYFKSLKHIETNVWKPTKRNQS